MATDIRFEFDEISVENIKKKLGSMGDKAPTVLKRAVNDTARQARRDLAAKAQQAYAVKVGAMTKYVKIKNATNSDLEAILRISGAHLPITQKYFSVQGGHGPRGPHLKTLIKRSSGVQTWGPGAFQNTLGQSGHSGAAERVGAERLPIKAKYTVSIPGMFANEKEVYGAVEPHIQSNLRANVERHIGVILGG